jgi:hypothetical protein
MLQSDRHRAGLPDLPRLLAVTTQPRPLAFFNRKGETMANHDDEQREVDILTAQITQDAIDRAWIAISNLAPDIAALPNGRNLFTIGFLHGASFGVQYCREVLSGVNTPNPKELG